MKNIYYIIFLERGMGGEREREGGNEVEAVLHMCKGNYFT